MTRVIAQVDLLPDLASSDLVASPKAGTERTVGLIAPAAWCS